MDKTITSKTSIAVSEYLSLETFKADTTLDLIDYTDPKIQEFIDRAILFIDQWLGSSVAYGYFEDESIRCSFDYPRNGLNIQLPRRPILSIKEVSLNYGRGSTINWSTPTAVAVWRINKKVGYIEYLGIDSSGISLSVCSRDPLASNISPLATVKYYAGYKEIPSAVSKATQILVEQLILNAQGEDTEISSVAVGNYREGYKRSIGIKSMGVVGGADQVEKLLRPYRQPGQTLFTSGPLS